MVKRPYSFILKYVQRRRWRWRFRDHHFQNKPDGNPYACRCALAEFRVSMRQIDWCRMRKWYVFTLIMSNWPIDLIFVFWTRVKNIEHKAELWCNICLRPKTERPSLKFIIRQNGWGKDSFECRYLRGKCCFCFAKHSFSFLWHLWLRG